MAEFQRFPGINVGSRNRKGIFQTRDREFLVEKKRVTDSDGSLVGDRMFQMAALTVDIATQEVVNAMIPLRTNPQNSSYPCYSPMLPMDLFQYLDDLWFKSLTHFAGFRVIDATETVSKKEQTKYALIAGVLDQRIRTKSSFPASPLLQSFGFLGIDNFEFAGGDARWRESVQSLDHEIPRSSSPTKIGQTTALTRRRSNEYSLFQDFARYFGVQIVVFFANGPTKSFVPEERSPPYPLIQCGYMEDAVQFLFYTEEEMRESYIDPWTRQPLVCLIENRSVFDFQNRADFNTLLNVLYAFLLCIGGTLQSNNSPKYKALFDSVLASDSVDFIKKFKSTVPEAVAKRFFKRSCDSLYAALRICGICKETEADLIGDCGCAVCKKCLIRAMVEAREHGCLAFDHGEFQPFKLTLDCAKSVPFSSVKPLLSPSDIRNLKEFPTCRECKDRKKPMLLSCRCSICELCGLKKAASTGQSDYCYFCKSPIPSQTRSRLRPHAALRRRP